MLDEFNLGNLEVEQLERGFLKSSPMRTSWKMLSTFLSKTHQRPQNAVLST